MGWALHHHRPAGARGRAAAVGDVPPRSALAHRTRDGSSGHTGDSRSDRHRSTATAAHNQRDRTPDMLSHAAAKGLETVLADAQRLPFADASFDAVTMISMLHHVEDRRAALAEAKRVLRRSGRLVLKGFTAEDAASLWVLDLFPSSWQWMMETHPPLSAFLDELPGAETVR